MRCILFVNGNWYGDIKVGSQNVESGYVDRLIFDGKSKHKPFAVKLTKDSYDPIIGHLDSDLVYIDYSVRNWRLRWTSNKKNKIKEDIPKKTFWENIEI